MTSVIQLSAASRTRSSVVALHCSFGSGRQWTRLKEALGGRHQFIAPDISGYGGNRGSFNLPTSLAQEIGDLHDHLKEATGPIHLVGHSYGGAIAFRIATASPFASRVRSLTLIEPVLPTLLGDNNADRPLHDQFKRLALEIYQDLWNGLSLEALEKFTDYWNGSGPADPIPENARLRMIECADKIAFDFSAVLSEEGLKARAALIGVPTLLFSGGLSPIMTQRIVERLTAIIPDADTRHLPGAGHMMPLSHAATIIPEIVKHIAHVDVRAEVLTAAE
jgi:pimeloyl-ACP methyl ester carboxylesterase